MRRRSEYKEWEKKVKELVDESKMRIDEEFGRKLSERFMENRKLFLERGEERERRCRRCEFENEEGGWNAW